VALRPAEVSKPLRQRIARLLPLVSSRAQATNRPHSLCGLKNPAPICAGETVARMDLPRHQRVVALLTSEGAQPARPRLVGAVREHP